MKYSHGPIIRSKKPITEALEPDQIATLGKRYHGRDRALFYFLYLSGARIIEALRTKVRDLEERSSDQWGKINTIRLMTVKNRRTKFRIIPIPTRQTETPMIEFLYRYIGDKGQDEQIFPYLTTRNAWNRLAKEVVTVRAVDGNKVIEKFQKKINPHYLRHCRLTHMVQYYGFNDTRLTRFAGWTNSDPAMVYVHLDWQDLARSMFNSS